MFRRILTNAIIAAIAVIVGVPLIVTAWFYIGGIETASLPDDADLVWTPPVVADEDNAFVAILAATNLVKLATDDYGFERSIVDGYAYISYLSSTSSKLREDQSAVEKADRILADNAAFYAAFAEGLERKAYSIKNLDSRAFALALLELRLWAFKAQREADRGEWDAAVNSLEVLSRFGRIVSDNAAYFSDHELGAIAEEFVLRKIVDLAAVEGFGEKALLRLAALADEDEAASASNCVRTVRGTYTELVSEMPKKSAADLLRFLDCYSPFRRVCPVLEHWPFYRGFALDERWTRRRLADVAHAFLRGEADLAADERFCPPINPFACNWFGRHQVNGFALSCRNRLKGSRVNKWVTLLRTRARIVVAAARWRLAHGGEMPPTLDALVPQYLPAVPLDPWSKDGKPFSYDAAAGVVWSVGESGDFDYSKLPAGESKRVRGEIGRNVDYYAFRLDGKPLTLMDNAKCTLPPQAGQEGGDHANIERYIAFQKRRCPEIKDADIGKEIILRGAPLLVSAHYKNGCKSEVFDFSADDKRYYVDRFVLGNEPVKQALQKLLMDEPAKEIPENAFLAFIQLGLEEKFNSQYQERLHSDRSDLHIDTDEGQLSIMLRESGCTNGAMTPYTQSDAHYGVPCASVVLASGGGEEIFSVASALDNKDSGLYLSTMFSRDMKSYSVGVVFADSLLRRIPHKSRLHVHVPGHGIVSFNLYNVGYRVRHDCHSKLPQ